MKLIRLSKTHYIIVDDSQIEKGDWVLPINNTPYRLKKAIDKLPSDKKITHSTIPLDIETIPSETANIKKVSWGNIKHIPLSEVEEAINGYSVEKMAHKIRMDKWGDEIGQGIKNSCREEGIIEGFKAHQQLVKDKVFTEEDVRIAIAMARTLPNDTGTQIIQSLTTSKTEWDVEFDEQGKLKLI